MRKTNIEKYNFIKFYLAQWESRKEPKKDKEKICDKWKLQHPLKYGVNI